jgi:hypothetical protein
VLVAISEVQGRRLWTGMRGVLLAALALVVLVVVIVGALYLLR